MIRKLIHILVIVVIIAGLCIAEQLLFKTYFDELDEKVGQIKTLLTSNQELNNEISFSTDDLHSYWLEKENILCTFVNHKEIDDIGVEIEKMRTSISNNDKDKYEESLDLISFYIKSYRHLIGINIQNIF